MNIEAGLLLALGGLLLLGILTVIGRIIGRGSFAGGCLFPVLVFAGIFLAGSYYLDRNGEITIGKLVNKQEQIRTDSTGSWNRTLNVDVEFTPHGASLPSTVRLGVDPALYDRLSVGTAVEVRYIYPSEIFLFSRLAEQTTLSMIPWQDVWRGFLIVSLIVIVWMWFQKPRRPLTVESPPEGEPVKQRRPLRPLAVALFGLWLVAVNVTIFQPMFYPVAGEQWLATTAKVKEVRRYIELTESTRTSRTVNTIQPFDIVQFEFVPQGQRDMVIGVDVVDVPDVETTRLPEIGSTLSITYPQDNPRGAAIVRSTRTHYWKNPLGEIGAVVGSLLVFGLLWLGVQWMWRNFWAALQRR